METTQFLTYGHGGPTKYIQSTDITNPEDLQLVNQFLLKSPTGATTIFSYHDLGGESPPNYRKWKGFMVLIGQNNSSVKLGAK